MQLLNDLFHRKEFAYAETTPCNVKVRIHLSIRIKSKHYNMLLHIKLAQGLLYTSTLKLSTNNCQNLLAQCLSCNKYTFGLLLAALLLFLNRFIANTFCTGANKRHQSIAQFPSERKLFRFYRKAYHQGGSASRHGSKTFCQSRKQYRSSGKHFCQEIKLPHLGGKLYGFGNKVCGLSNNICRHGKSLSFLGGKLRHLGGKLPFLLVTRIHTGVIY